MLHVHGRCCRKKVWNQFWCTGGSKHERLSSSLLRSHYRHESSSTRSVEATAANATTSASWNMNDLKGKFSSAGMRQRKIKKRGKLLHVRERSDRTSWGWVREGGSPSRRKFCNFRYWKSCFNAEKNQKKRKIATCEGAQRPNLLGVGSGGGFPLPQKILQF